MLLFPYVFDGWSIVKLTGTMLFVLGRSWAGLGRSSGALGAVLGGLVRSWGLLERSWALLGRSLGALGALLGALGRSWALLEPPRAILVRFWSLPGSILAPPRFNFWPRPELVKRVAAASWRRLASGLRAVCA